MHSTRLVKMLAIAAIAGIFAATAGVSSEADTRSSGHPDAEEIEDVVSSPQALTGSCGVERWSVKTGTDADASKITLQSTTQTTIASLGALPKPGTLPANNRVQPTETTVFQLHATLTEYKLEADSDYHLVLDDGSGHTMIGEIPDPNCVGAGSPLASGIQKSRNEFDAKYTATGSFQTANVPVTVTGVGFFDFLHGQTGVAPNGIELHAILDVQFGSGTASVSVTNPGTQTGTVGQAASLQIQASASDGGSLSYSATGLPAGLSIDAGTGLITGTPSTAATSTVTVTATDSTGPTGSTTFSWTVNPAGGATVSVTNPGSQTGTVGQAASLQIQASASDGGSLSYSATGLPAGLSIDAGSGLITGTPTTAGTSNVTVTATDSTGPTGSTTFTWTVNPAGGGGCSPAQLLGNPGFETGTAAPWSASSGIINNSSTEPPHSGSWDAWLDGYGTTHTDTLSQQVTLPTGCATYALSFWLHVDTAEPTTTAYDTLTVQVLNASGTVLATPATFSNKDAAAGYTQHTLDMSAYAGQTITVLFTGTEDYTKQTSFVLDDTALNVN